MTLFHVCGAMSRSSLSCEPISRFLSGVIAKTCRIAMVIFTTIVAGVLWVGQKVVSSVKWVVNTVTGCCVTRGDVSYQGVRLNRANFHLAPEPLNFNAVNPETDGIHVGDLVGEYQRIEQENPPRPGERRSPSLENPLRELVNLAARRPVTNYETLYFGTMNKCLQRIIFELRKPEVPVEKKRRALRSLAEAMEWCPPRKLEECQRQCRLLRSSVSEMARLLLGYVQDLKEEIFLEAYDRGQFHVLNNIRRLAGDEFGLNRSAVNLQDPYIHVGGSPSLDDVRETFHSRYTTERLIQGVMTRMHLDGNNAVWTEHMRQQLGQDAIQRGEDPNADAVAERIIAEATSFFDNNLINERGVIFLLKSLGIVIPG